MQKIDWAKLQSFVLVAEHGSLSAAARASGASQPTLSRHIATLEEDLGLRLFDRTPEGLVLTASGTEIYTNAEAMNASADQIALIASGRSQEISGSVRVTASDTVARFSLPPIFAALRRAEPSIAIELVASNDTNNLLKREADIAIRMYRPTQNDVITRKVGELRVGFFATRAYLDLCGRPETPQDLKTHELIGLDKSEVLIQGFRKQGVEISREDFAFRTDAMFINLELILSGLGIGLLHADLAEEFDDLEPVLERTEIEPLEFWLTAHSELKSSPRIRRVYDFIGDALMERYGHR